jgi:hypothetical protein
MMRTGRQLLEASADREEHDRSRLPWLAGKPMKRTYTDEYDEG